MNSQTIRIPVKAWYGDEELELQFPEVWEVKECRMAGHDIPALTDEQIHEALQRPLGTKPLGQMAHGKKQVVILFDDLARPTPTWKVLPFILEELREAGIQDDQIRLVAAYGSHVAMGQEDFVKKLGKEVVRRFRIYNHNVYENLVDLGKTSRGTPVLINREVMDCDLKIGIGCLIPNHAVEFGGGAKIILPGVSGIDSIYYNHQVIGGKAEMGKKFQSRIEGNEMLQDMEEIAQKAGLDMKIDVLINHKREIIRMFVGDFIVQRRRGVEEARKLYATSILKECDVVITNTYPTENQAVRGIWPANLSLKEGGYSVVVVEGVDGQTLHYGGGRFGTNYGGRMWKPPQKLMVPNAQRILICSSYLARTDLDRWGPSDRVLSCATWGEVLIHLMAAYPQKARVAVYPYAPMQVPKEN